MTAVKRRREVQNRRIVPESHRVQYMARPALAKLAVAFASWLALFLLAPLAALADKMVWAKVRAGLGGRTKCLISGGSLMPSRLDDFYEMIGTHLIVGYGLTETSPTICNRLTEKNIAGTCGLPCPLTTLKIVDVETGAELSRAVGIGLEFLQESDERVGGGKGGVGVVWAKGPQVSRGYHNREEATREVFDSEGFFCTGDLGQMDPVTGHLVITGRAKDTIVLNNGENVEPAPIEECIMESELIDQVMVVGQDQKGLCALAVINIQSLAALGLVPESKVGQNLF